MKPEKIYLKIFLIFCFFSLFAQIEEDPGNGGVMSSIIEEASFGAGMHREEIMEEKSSLEENGEKNVILLPPPPLAPSSEKMEIAEIKEEKEKEKKIEKQPEVKIKIPSESEIPEHKKVLLKVKGDGKGEKNLTPEEEEAPILTDSFLDTPIGRKNGKKVEIVIGATLPLSGNEAVIGKEIFAGMNLVFNKVNEKGGIKGCRIKFYSYDDSFEYPRIVTNLRKLLKKGSVLISLYGYSSMKALLPHLKSSQALALFPVVGSLLVRHLDYKNVIYFRASEKKEISSLLSAAIKKYNKRDVAIFYEKSDWGKAALRYATDFLEKNFSIKVIAKGSYPQETVNITNAINKIAQGDPTVILCLANSRATYNFIRRAINKGLHNCLFLGISRTAAARETLLEARGINLIVSSVVPDPATSKIKIVRQYREDMTNYLPAKKYSKFSLEGYINAMLLVQVLKSIKAPLTPRKIIKKLESLKKAKYRGLRLRFGVEPRTLSPQVWLTGV